MFKYQLINDPEAWEELKIQWNDLLLKTVTNYPFLRFEYLRQWWQTRGGGEWEDGALIIVTASDDAGIVGIAPLFQKSNPDGSVDLLFIGSFEISDYLDFIVPQEYLDEFLNGLFQFLDASANTKWSRLDLYNILDDSPSLSALEKVAKKQGWQYEAEVLQFAPRIHLPGDWEKYLAGIDKKQRHEIRRKMRRLEHSGHGHRWYIVDDAATLDRELEGFLHLMALDEKKRTFLTPIMREQMLGTMRCAFEAGCLHLALLEIDGTKAAGYLSFYYDNQLWVYNSGVNHEQYDFSPGWVLLGYLLQWANENSILQFDFMRGNEDYKYKFGAVDRSVLRVQITR